VSSLREQLEAIREEHGYLDPDLVVEVATPKTHPLHDRLEWDNRIAGTAWRQEQAHRLIQSVRVRYMFDDQPKDVRAYVAVPREGARQPSYEPTEEAMRDPFMRQLVLGQMQREWQSLKARYGDLAEFAELVVTAASEVAA
jgi:hypothetical protein